jgi:uncharacterized membrane protein YsdA (DUF1294 family)
MTGTVVAVYLVLVVVVSLVTFAAFGWDKRRAAGGGRRVPERTLLVLALAGGWPGAILARRQFRHKTRKGSFVIAFWVVVALHVALVGAVAYAMYRTPFAESDGQQRSIIRNGFDSLRLPRKPLVREGIPCVACRSPATCRWARSGTGT